MDLDLFKAIKLALIIAVGITDILLPIMLLITLVRAAEFLRDSTKKKYEDCRYSVKKVKNLFTFQIISSVIFIFIMLSGIDNGIVLAQGIILVFLIILGIIAFNLEKKAAALYRNLYPPKPTYNAYKNNAQKSMSDLSAINSDEDWDKLFGENNGNFNKQDRVNMDLDIRKAPDRELMQYLEGGDTRTAPTMPAEHKEAGKAEELNICPECGYLNFEGNAECDFCRAKLKKAEQ